MNSTRRLLFILVGAWLLFAPPAARSEESPPPSKAEPTRAEEQEQLLPLYEMLAEAVAHIELHHARPVDRRKLFESAVRGMLSDLDPYSKYLGPDEFERYQARVRGDDGDPATDDPATPTVLGRRRAESGEWDYWVRDQPRVACVTVTSFTSHTAAELQDVLNNLRDADALVVDLRFNAGGLLSAAIDVADLFLGEGPIVATQGRNTERREWRATPSTGDAKQPLAALVNRYSASGAEVVAAALEDNSRATIVGERSWGKGSVQNFFELEGGRSGIKLTTALYHRPSGANIHRLPGMSPGGVWGVAPAAAWTLAIAGDEAQALLDRRHALLAGESPQAPVADRQLDLAITAAIRSITDDQPPTRAASR